MIHVPIVVLLLQTPIVLLSTFYSKEIGLESSLLEITQLGIGRAENGAQVSLNLAKAQVLIEDS